MRYASSLLALGRLVEAAAALRPVLASASNDEIGGVLLAGATVISQLATAPWGRELGREQIARLRGPVGVAPPHR